MHHDFGGNELDGDGAVKLPPQLLGLLLLVPSCALAQQITITGQVKDPNNIPFTNGRGRVLLVPTNVAFTTGLTNPVPGSQSPVIIDGLDAFGRFSVTLTSTAAIDQQSSNPKWMFTFCSAPIQQFGPICFTMAPLALTSSQDITAQITATPPPILPLSGGGGGSPGGVPIQTQVNNGGAFGGTACESFGDINVGPENIDCDARFKGPNPYVDSRRYGVRTLLSANAIPAVSGITATATGGSPAVTVSTTVCNLQSGNVCFVNGDGIVVAGAGTTNNMTVPQTVSVAPSNAQVGTQTGSVVSAPTGATTYNYRVFACDLGGGCGPASVAASTTTGTASLGPQSQAGYSATRSNDTETFTVGSQPAFSVGTVVLVDTPTGTGDTDFMGFKEVATVTGTGFTVVSAPLDTRNGARLSSNGTYTVHWFNLNHVTWTAPASGAPFRYFVCSDRASPGTYHVIGPARLPVNPHNSNFTGGTLQFDDFGATMMAASASVVPWYVSDANCTAGAATNDNWVTTLLSGAGTTTLTMTANAPNSAGPGAVIRFDNTPNLKTAVSTAYISGTGPSVALPWDPAFGIYVFNSVADLSANDPILLFPIGARFNDTLILGSAAQLYGDVMAGKGSAASFQSKSVPYVSGAGLPTVFVGAIAGGANSVFTKGLGFSAPDNGIAFLQDGGGGNLGSTYTDDQFVSGNASADYLGIAFACRGVISASCTGSWKGKNLFVSGNQNMAGLSNTPSFTCDECGAVVFDEVMANGRGFFMGFAADAGMSLRIGHSDAQGISTPFITLSRKNSGNAGVQLWLGDAGQALLDTVTQSCVVYLPTSIGNLGVDFKFYGGCIPSGAVPQFTGQRMTSPGITGVTQVQNKDTAGFTYGTAFDGIFASSGGNVQNYPIFAEEAAHETGSTYPIFVQAPPMAQPTCSVSSGGSVSIGSHTYQIAPVWQNGGMDKPSQPSTACVTSTGNQKVTINWTPSSGSPKGYEPFEDGISRQFTGAICSTIPQVTPGSTSSVVMDADTACPLSVPTIPAGGASMLMPGVQGIASPAIVIAGSTPLTGVQGTDTKIMSAGTVNPSSSLVCTDANGGAATSGCATTGSGSVVLATAPTVTTPVINGVDAQTGTSYTMVAADEQKLLTLNNAAAIAVTLPQATTAGFGAGTSFHVRNLGAGTVTITPTTSTIDGGANLVLLQGQGADIYSDGTNYETQRGLTSTGVLQSVNSTTTTCPTSSTAGSTCTFTVTWPNAFADTAYTPSCIGGGTITGFPFIQGFSSKTTSALTVVVVNGTSNEAVVSGYSEMDCIGRHP